MKEKGRIIYQQNEASGRMEIICRGHIGTENLLSYLDSMQGINPEIRQGTLAVLEDSRKLIGEILSLGGVITTAGDHIFNIHKIKSAQVIYDEINKKGIVEKQVYQVPELPETSRTNTPEAKAFYMADNFWARLDCELSERGAPVSIFFNTHTGNSELPRGIEDSFIVLIKNINLRRGIYPLIAPRTVFKQILLDLIMAKAN